MKNNLMQLLQDQGDLSIEQIVIRIAMTFILGLLLFLSYAISQRGTIYNRKFNVSLVMLSVLTGTVMIVIGNNIALVIYGILMARLVNGMLLTPLGIHHPNGECPNEAICLLIQTLLGTAITIVTGEFLPKTLFRINPNRMLTICALPAYIIYILLWPISKFTSSLSKVTLWLLGQKPSKEDTDRTFKKADLDYLIQSNIERAEEGGGIEDEVKIFQNALDFSSVKVRDCTIPRTEINAVDDQTDTATLLNTFVESGH